MDEKPYGIPDICALLRISVRRARRLFQHEPSVLLFMPTGYLRPEIQVPPHVLLRVLQRLAVPGPGWSLQDESAALVNGDAALYKIGELCAKLNLGESRARRLFEHEPGVLHVIAPGDKRPSIRVPEWVLQRVLRRSAVPEFVKRR